MKNPNKTKILVTISSLAAVIVAFLTQLRAQESITEKCSYLDPILIDILAFSAALFLIIEGICSIAKEKNKPWKKHISRSIRIAFGFAIITLHIMQFIYK